MLVVEVDGSSHQRPDRRERDETVDAALVIARVPIMHLRVGEDWRGPLLAWAGTQRSGATERAIPGARTTGPSPHPAPAAFPRPASRSREAAQSAKYLPVRWVVPGALGSSSL